MLPRKSFGDLDGATHALESQDKRLNEMFLDLTSAEQGKFFPLDLVAFAVIQRSLSLGHAVVSLIRAQNYIAAASMLRLQLDSCTRFHAAWLVDKPHEFAMDVLRGKPIRKLKSAGEDRLTDQFLVDNLSGEFPWMRNVYKQCSGFVHLSEKHLYSVIEDISDDGAFTFRVGASQERTNHGMFLELATAFHHLTDVLLWLLSGWLSTKKSFEEGSSK